MKGYALHIGLNYCNPRDFSDCALDGAVPDALALRDATASLSFENLNGDGTLLDAAATESGIISAIENAAATVQAGEMLLITFNGLGLPLDFIFELPVLQRRRGWVTYDGNVVDVAEVLQALSGAPAGARVLVISSCCFIGAQPGPEEVVAARVAARSLYTSSGERPRVGSARMMRRALAAAQARIESPAENSAGTSSNISTIVKSAAARIGKWNSRGPGGATVYHLAACGIDEVILDGTADTRSPFAAAIRDLLLGDPQTFPSLESELKLLLDPDPQLEKFPVDAAFDAVGPFLRDGGFLDKKTA